MSPAAPDSPGGEQRVKKILAKIAGYTREVADDEALIELARTGVLMPYDPVWHPASGRWAHAQELEILLAAFHEARTVLEARMKADAERKASLGFFGRLLDRFRKPR